MREVGYCLWGQSEKSGLMSVGGECEKGYCLWGESERRVTVCGGRVRGELLSVGGE